MPDVSPILMPKLGLTMTEGLLSSWLVKPGDQVSPGDVIFVVETEKIANEIEAPAAGRIETIVVGEGETVPVGTVVATWTGPSGGSDVAGLKVEQAASIPDTITAVPSASPSQGPRPAPQGTRIIATPLARRLAAGAGIDLSTVSGSGPKGRIKAADVEAARNSASAVQPEPAPLFQPSGQGIAVSPARRIIAQRLTQSKQTVPHFYVLAQADVTRLLVLRQELNETGEKTRISINHFIVAAVGRALAAMPEFRVLWQEGSLIELPGSDVGIAVDAPSGLIVPVLRNAGGLGLDRLADVATDLVERARQGRLTAADVQGGVLSVSNVGMFGAAHLVPIINPGQTAILGVGSTRPTFRPDNAGSPELRQEVGLVLSADHRAVDGVLTARFLDLIVHHLEHPLLLLRGS